MYAFSGASCPPGDGTAYTEPPRVKRLGSAGCGWSATLGISVRKTNQHPGLRTCWLGIGEGIGEPVSDIPISVEMLGGGEVRGLLAGASGPPLGQRGAVYLNTGAPELEVIPSEDIAAFTLFPGAVARSRSSGFLGAVERVVWALTRSGSPMG